MGMKKEWTYRRGDIYLANLNPFKGSEQGGKRPVVVLQNNTGNLQPVGRLKTASVVQLEQIKTIDKCRVLKYFGRIPAEHMKEINRIIKISMGIIRIPKDYRIYDTEDGGKDDNV